MENDLLDLGKVLSKLLKLEDCKSLYIAGKQETPNETWGLHEEKIQYIFINK